MELLEKRIKETTFTIDEWKIYRKVELNSQLNDLEFVLTEMLENEELTPEVLKIVMQNIDIILNKFDAYLYCDWRSAMVKAIKYSLGVLNNEIKKN